MECRHSIRKQRISLSIDSEELALVLHPRLSDLNQKKLLPVLERVMDEFTVDGQHIKINKLDIDLGLLSFTTFEQQLSERFESELRDVMQQTVNNFSDNSNALIESEKTSRFKLLEYYLVQGTLPWNVHQRSDFNCETLFMELVAEDWPVVMELIKKHSHMTYVIERIAAQLQEHSLRRLLQLLEPKHGALIVAYLVDMNSIQLSQHILPLNHSAYHRLLWVLALTYTINERGSQFNRRSFVKAMLEDMAHNEGLNYVQLLNMFDMGLVAVEKNHPMQSSLPAVIADLVREQQRKAELPLSDDSNLSDVVLKKNAIDDGLELLEHYLMTGSFPSQAYNNRGHAAVFAEILKHLSGKSSSQFMHLLRRLAKQSKLDLSLLIERLLNAFTPSELLTILATDKKVLIETWINLLITNKSESNARPIMTNDRMAWEAVFHYLISEASTLWPAQEMVQETLVMIAQQVGVTANVMAVQLHSLLGSYDNGSVKNLLSQALLSIDEKPSLATVMEVPVKQLFLHYDNIELLQYYLKYGVLPWYQLLQNPDLSPKLCISSLLNLSYYRLCTVFSFASKNQQRDGLLRMVQILSDSQLDELLNKLLPPNNSGEKNKLNFFSTSILSFASQAQYKTTFYTQLFSCLLNHQPIDLEMMAAASEFNCELSCDPAQWHSDQLQSVLIDRLQKHQLHAKLKPDSFELFQTLVEEHPKACRSLMIALYQNSELTGQLLSHSPVGLIDQLLEQLQPVNAQTLKALIIVFETVAAPYRPRLEDLRRIIVGEALHLEHPFGEDFFTRVLQQLFPGTMSASLKQHLLKSVASWKTMTKLPAVHISSFKTAINAAITGQPQDGNNPDISNKFAPPSIRDDNLHEQVLAMLLTSTPGKSVRSVVLSNDQLQQAITELFEQSPQILCTFIHQHIYDAKVRDHWINVLPESSLVRIAWLLQPQQLRSLLDSAEILAAAWLDCAPANHPELKGRDEYWRFMLQFFAQHSGANCTLSALTAAFFNYFAGRFSNANQSIAVISDTDKKPGLNIAEKLREEAMRLAHKAGHNHLLSLLQQQRYGSFFSGQQQIAVENKNVTENIKMQKTDNEFKVKRNQTVKPKSIIHPAYQNELQNEGENYYIDNAGLVLLGVFLSHLFKSLDMLIEGEEERTRLRDSETITRAVHLLQYLIDGSTSTSESSLILNKIMCGVPLNCVVDNTIQMNEDESVICDQLLNAVLARWESINNTSIEGLQQTFLQREGRLVKSVEGWKLRVQRKTVDVLVDQIPWRVSMVSESWMPTILYVEW